MFNSAFLASSPYHFLLPGERQQNHLQFAIGDAVLLAPTMTKVVSELVASTQERDQFAIKLSCCTFNLIGSGNDFLTE